MRIHFMILPSLLLLAACAKTSDKLRMDHSLKASVETASDNKLNALMDDQACLPVEQLYKYLTTLSQVNMTDYVRTVELYEGVGKNAKPLSDDKAGPDLLQTLAEPVLIESFTGNTLGRTQLLQDLLVNIDQTGCGATIAGESFTSSNAVKGPSVNSKTDVKTQSATRTSLQLINRAGDRLINYRETGTTLVITVTEPLPKTFAVCDKAANTKYSRVTEYVLVHSGKFNTASITAEFANILNTSLTSVPSDLSDKLKAVPTANKVVDSRTKGSMTRAGRVELGFNLLESLQNSLAAKLFQTLSCTVPANGKPG